MKQRPHPIESAKQFTKKYFPNCTGALLSGSVVRGEETATSDLDMVIFEEGCKNSYRESLVDQGWPIELFVHNLSSYKEFFKSDVDRGRPSLPRMVAEGTIVKEHPFISAVKKEAEQLLVKGPEAWTKETIEVKRYFLTDALDDFLGSTKREEDLFIAPVLAELIIEFYLRTNQQWVGHSKWAIRALRQYDDKFADRIVEAFDTFYRMGDKRQVIAVADSVLEKYGGRLFAGYSMGKGES
ncbi:nucleotidyltransferase domain-containing protein [Halobacillus shinanisalinarum]|uniref:Nucleotidyltransferase domain-containing protein n=1 Tax=Halobacillus shinanisalinarum TaxID=2932258 RepID=A0ABY4GY64_9BACI|nr:nucleotidyltransferase domain-containing protein [Halobacillus shinanisalinarum]UOQ91717.1 nucleotidyltransferase domain-containing protein [Halobacillus shinanisalinarum]